ncbi:hypothetical protein JOQ06_027217 [Pogonophryne albipinna]|uniref:Uncharacterized protein n=1 Tax=Pogonophryne albipinna TaxID=1090488 RepID=A0AAD6BEZ5_9TELE|nr:hypothetical protein JOQ06_027217 [Pogonophryne albipinna]
MVTFSRSAPWYTGELRRMKTAGCVFERRLKDSRLTVHRLAYREHQKAYAQSLRDARSQYYSSIINNSTGNSKQLISTINHLLKPQSPLHSDSTEKQCKNFAAFFINKVDTIRSILSSPSAPPVPTADPQPGTTQPLRCFTDISQREKMQMSHRPVEWLAVMLLVVFTAALCQQNESRRAVSEHQLMHRPRPKHPESQEAHLAVQRHRGSPHCPDPLCFQPHKDPEPGSESSAGVWGREAHSPPGFRAS